MWIKELPHFSAERRTCGSDLVEKETLEAIVEAVNELKVTSKNVLK